MSITLGLSAILLAMLLGVPLGTLAAIHRTARQITVRAFAILGSRNAQFRDLGAVVCLDLWHLSANGMPVSGWSSGEPRYFALPVLTLPHCPSWRISRGSLAPVSSKCCGLNYIRTARAKGIGEWRVMLRHALQPALMPVVSYATGSGIYDYRIAGR